MDPNQFNNQMGNFQPSMNDYNPYTNMLHQIRLLQILNGNGMCSVQPMVNDFNSDRNNRRNQINNIQQRPNDLNFFINGYYNNNEHNNINNYQGIESKKNERLFSINCNNENNIINPNNQNEDSNIKKNKKIKLNILYYDENLKIKNENRDICTYFEMNLSGTFYGCHSFKLFRNVCEKIRRNKTKFILISSGSSAESIFKFCSNMEDEIREYYIYCKDKENYLSLMEKYPKLKGVYNVFNVLKEKLSNIDEIENENKPLSNLFFFEDYSKIYIKLHYEFIRKYGLYKLLKKYKLSESEFLDYVEKKKPNFLDLAKQLFPDKNEIIEYFKNNVNDNIDNIEEIFDVDNNLLDDNISSYISNYTKEGFYYRNLNKFLREGNFEAFRILSSHVAKFIYKLYDYRKSKNLSQKRSDLYRKLYLNKDDINKYEESIGKVICYPSFTSTSLKRNGFNPDSKYKGKDDELVLLIIKQNKTKSVISIKEYSEFEQEDEYLFLPFSFFKIIKVEKKKGSTDDPHIIHLIALNSVKPIEEMFDDFIAQETSTLSPEGLDLLILDEDGTKIVFNKLFFPNYNGGCNCDCKII